MSGKRAGEEGVSQETGGRRGASGGTGTEAGANPGENEAMESGGRKLHKGVCQVTHFFSFSRYLSSSL